MADQRGFLAPAASVPLFMEAALKYPEHREALLRLAGRRGQYLAEQNPDWAQLRRIGSRRDELWLSPDPDDRTAWFDYIRTVDPELASEELEIAWDDEATASRLHFLDHLDVGLGEHDYALLERALDDPAVRVRERAIQLLRQLPRSPFASRMVTRARSWVRLETKPLRPRLAVRLPGSLDDLAFRDGIEDVHYKNKGIRRWWLTASRDRHSADAVGIDGRFTTRGPHHPHREAMARGDDRIMDCCNRSPEEHRVGVGISGAGRAHDRPENRRHRGPTRACRVHRRRTRGRVPSGRRRHAHCSTASTAHGPWPSPKSC